MIGGGRGEVLQYDWVPLLTQRGQVTDVQLQFVAVLIEIQEGRDNLRGKTGKRTGKKKKLVTRDGKWKIGRSRSLLGFKGLDREMD